MTIEGVMIPLSPDDYFSAWKIESFLLKQVNSVIDVLGMRPSGIIQQISSLQTLKKLYRKTVALNN